MPKGIYKRTDYHKKINKDCHLGIKLSKKTRERMSKRMIGNKINKGRFGKLNGHYGKKHSERTKKTMSELRKGKKLSIEAKRKLSNLNKGNKTHLWKGGITPKNLKIRQGIEFRLWRESVFARDNWTCQKYRIRGCKLHSHHIQNFSDYPELRFAIDNGITLSEKAHKEFHKKYGYRHNTLEQLTDFLTG